MANADMPSLLDLEDKLRQDEEGRYKNSLLDELEEHDRALKRMIDRGVTAPEFERLNKTREAVEAARSAVTKLWQFHHPGATL